ncbi:hypothetical protein BC6307_18055 [Sutcliffiella cohnii]|uniref:Uncharacterized protein n=1 Tax=Sutcliffiella cohnii TaxID=33932 RepID=A0A223KUI2_9BACI|nr:hypothetical protein [Sutcliffiella cohnii]AST93024.1 hypothetical protein BC6307_18055 [Sutcliffiella cohnii]
MKIKAELKAEQYMALAVGGLLREGMSVTEITAFAKGCAEKFETDKKVEKLLTSVKDRDPSYEVQGNLIKADFGLKK